MVNKIVISLYILGVFLLPNSVQASDSKPFVEHRKYVDNECIVKFNEGIKNDSIQKIGQILGFQTIAYFELGDFYRIRILDNETPLHFSMRLNNNDAVLYAQPDYYLKKVWSSADSLYRSKWDPEDVQFFKAYLGDNRTEHMLKKTEIIIATVGLNFSGNAGKRAAPFSQISYLPIKIDIREGVSRSSDIAQGIYDAIEMGAAVIKLSYMGPNSPVLQDALQSVVNKRGVTICVTDNASSEFQDSTHFPGSYNKKYITIAPNNSGRVRKTKNSNSGNLEYSQIRETDYSLAEYSSPVIAAVSVAAVLAHRHDVYGTEKMRQIFNVICQKENADKLSQLSDGSVSKVTAKSVLFPEFKHDIALSVTKIPKWCIQGEHVQIMVSIKNQGAFEEKTTVLLYDSLTSTTISQVDLLLKSGETKNRIFVWDTESEIAGTHALTISASSISDEDQSDNVVLAEIDITNDFRDVAIVGVEFINAHDQILRNANIQLVNNGTYNEVVHIVVKDIDGSIAGSANQIVEAMSYSNVAVNIESVDISTGDSVRVEIKTSDQSEVDFNNNSMPLLVSF